MKLSIIFIGRNDNYNGNSYINRIRMSLNSLQHSLKGIDYEVVLVDYNQLTDRAPLKSFFDSYPEITHTTVTREEHYHFVKMQLEAGATLHEAKHKPKRDRNLCRIGMFPLPAWNAGFNASSGDFILHTSSDNIFPEGLADIINNAQLNCMYRAKRYNISPKEGQKEYQNIIHNKPYINRPTRMILNLESVPKTLWRAAGDFLLMDRKSWIDIGGYMPIMHPHPVNVDADLMYKALACGRKLFGTEYKFVNLHIPVSGYSNLKYYLYRDNFKYHLPFEYTRGNTRAFLKWAYKTKIANKEYTFEVRYIKRLATLKSVFKKLTPKRFIIY